jgi:hypothetical protein
MGWFDTDEKRTWHTGEQTYEQDRTDGWTTRETDAFENEADDPEKAIAFREHYHISR